MTSAPRLPRRGPDGEDSRETVLRDVLDGLAYDQVVIDTPSNLGLLTINALAAAYLVLAPVAAGDEGAAQDVAELRATLAKLARLRPAPPGLEVILKGQTAAGDGRDDRRRAHPPRPPPGRTDPGAHSG